MKTKLFALVFLLFSANVFAQIETVSYSTEYKAYYLEVTLQNTSPDSIDSTGADVDTVWVLYAPFYDARAWTPSTTRPTYNMEQIGLPWYNPSKPIFVSMMPDTGTGTADESDSLQVEVVPVDFYNPTPTTFTSGRFDVVSGIKSYFKFADGTLAATAQNLNWTIGAKYGVSFGTTTFPGRGFAIILRQIDNDPGKAITVVNLTISVPR